MESLERRLSSAGGTTSGEGARAQSHQNPPVEKDPPATMESRSLDFSLAEVRGSRAPKERSRLTARQASAGVPGNGSESASSNDATSIAAPSQTILTIMDRRCCTGSQWPGTEAKGAVVMLSKNLSAHLPDDVG